MVSGSVPSLMGRDWLGTLKPGIKIHRSAAVDGSLQKLLIQHADLLMYVLGPIKGVITTIHVDKTAQPQFIKHCAVPLALKARVEEEIIKLEKAGIIEPVAHLEWAVTVVPLVKQNGSIRLCGDVKLTVNKVASQEKYPLPCIEDMFSSLTSWTLQIRICSWNWRKKAGYMPP